MARATNRLTAIGVSRIKEPGHYGDGAGLWLQVSPSLSKSWVFRFSLNGRAREMGLGPLNVVTLAEARAKADACRKSLLSGADPIAARQAARAAMRAAVARAMTFDECAACYIEANRAGWKNEKHARQWESTVRTYASPIIGTLPVAGIDIGLVLKVLEPIWTVKPETASRLRGRIESVLDWARVREYRSGENPARWRGHLDKLLPARNKVAVVEHHAALPHADISTFMAELRGREGIAPMAVAFAILTAARSGEIRGATWNEIDMEGRVWTIPASRMKAGKEHRIPLSETAIAILESAPRLEDSDHVFPAPNGKGSPLSDMTLTAVLRRMGRADITVHGFRSTFRDWAGETTGYPREVIEHALAHQLKDKAEAAYARGSLFEKRRRLMDEWAAHCSKVRKREFGNVVVIGKAA